MSEDKIAYLPTGGGGRPPAPVRRRRSSKSSHLRLIDKVEGEGFDTLMVINALRGVCKALDHYAVEYEDPDMVGDLSMAARVLSAMVAKRVD